MKHRFQAAASATEQADRDLNLAEQIGDPLSPYLLTDEAARYLRFASAHLFRKWATRCRVPVQRRGRTLLYDRRVLDAFLNLKPWTLRHSDTVATVRPFGNPKSVAQQGGCR